MTDPAAPLCDSPQVVYEELIEEIRFALTNRPRNKQKMIGPSEVGEPCDRALIAALMGLEQPDEGVNWRAEVGTAIHEMFAGIFGRSILQKVQSTPRFLIEQRVKVGEIGGRPLVGSCDLFDVPTGIAIDWKSKSRTQLQKHSRHGPGQKYIVQAQCYAHGMALAGYDVKYTMFVFFPRDGEFGDNFPWFQPYDPQIVIDALERANRLHALGTALGAEVAMGLYPKCDEEFCRVCGNYRAPFGAPKKAAASTRELFARR